MCSGLIQRSVDDLHAQLVGYEGQHRIEHSLVYRGILSNQRQQHHDIRWMHFSNGFCHMLHKVLPLCVCQIV